MGKKQLNGKKNCLKRKNEDCTQLKETLLWQKEYYLQNWLNIAFIEQISGRANLLKLEIYCENISNTPGEKSIHFFFLKITKLLFLVFRKIGKILFSLLFKSLLPQFAFFFSLLNFPNKYIFKYWHIQEERRLFKKNFSFLQFFNVFYFTSKIIFFLFYLKIFKILFFLTFVKYFLNISKEIVKFDFFAILKLVDL